MSLKLEDRGLRVYVRGNTYPLRAQYQQRQPEAPGEDAVVAGRGVYKGRPCYIAGRVVRGRTPWDDRVAVVETKDGQRILLYSIDGSRRWWADRSEVLTTKNYMRPRTIRGLRRFTEEARRNGGVHPNACPRCGSLTCSAAYGRGGLCDED
jgi:hypothetical protein